MRPCVTVCLVLLLMGNAGAQDLANPIVQEVIITNVGPGHIDESFVLIHASVKTNAPWAPRQTSRGVRSLLDSGRFAKVEAYYEPVGDRVRIVYALENKYRLSDFPKIEGAEEVGERKLMKLLELGKGDLVDDQIMGNAARRMLKEYQEKFYPDAKITWSIEPLDRDYGTAAVTLYVDEGSKSRVRKMGFSGNESIEDDDLKILVSPRKFLRPWTWLRKLPIDPVLFEEKRRAIQNRYLDEGFLNATVDGPDVNRDSSGGVELQFRINEGLQYRVGAFSIGGTGGDVFPRKELLSLIRLRKGDVASSKLIATDTQRLRDCFGARGYIRTRVRPSLNPHPDLGVVDIHYEVVEGDLVTIQNIEIRGNARTRDKVIRRELLVYPGDIYNEVKVRQSERVLKNLGFFEFVRSDAIDTRVPDEKDLVFLVEEKRTGQFMVGAGFSSVDSLIGFIELSQGNFDLKGWPFTGGGQKLKVRAQVGSEREQVELSFVEPWFLDRKLSLGWDFFLTELDFSDYDANRVGTALFLGKPLPGPNRVNARYQIVSADITDVADTNAYISVDAGEEFFFETEEDSLKSSLELRFTHDTRSNPFVPKRGNRVMFRGEFAGGILGGDRDLFEFELRTANYLSPWWGHVLSFRTRWNVVDAYGDTGDVPIIDRLFIGGGRTVRGFEYRDVGPKAVRADSDGLIHRPIGGRTSGMIKAEYTVPVVPNIRVAGFFDIGNVWIDSFDFDIGNTASSTGFGLRFDMPGFPVRIDRAWVVEKDSPLTDTDKWVFWIGFE